jgi:hypothetical protein
VITQLDEVREGRLCWPEHKPRAAHRIDGPFKTGLDKALQEIKWEIERWRPLDYVISRNNQRIFAGDPAAALWWSSRKPPASGPNLRVLACDKYTSMAANAHAIYLTLDAMRALERWGAYTMEQAIEGAKLALPPPPGADAVDWRMVLGAVAAGVACEDALAIVNARYRRKAADAQGDEAELRRLNLAIEAARKELTA